MIDTLILIINIQMITIAEEHYTRLVELVRLLSRNMQLLHPSEALEEVVSEWRGVNQHLNSLYKKLEMDLGEILSRNGELDNENTELTNRLQTEKVQNNGLVQSITMLRAELAKNQAELAKTK